MEEGAGGTASLPLLKCNSLQRAAFAFTVVAEGAFAGCFDETEDKTAATGDAESC